METIDYKRIKFGLALGRMKVMPTDVPDFLAISGFHAAELPAACFQEPDQSLMRSLKQASFAEFHAGSLLDRELVREIPFASQNLRMEFAEQCSTILLELKKYGIRTASLELPMTQLLMPGNETARQDALDIVRTIAQRNFAAGQTLLIPYWIPAPADFPDLPAQIGRFLRDTMLPNVKLRLDVHPHELTKEFSLTAAAGNLIREVRSAVFIYDADSGNHFQEQHLLPWLEFLNQAGFEGPYLLCPNSKRNRMALPEAESFAAMTTKIRNAAKEGN